MCRSAGRAVVIRPLHATIAGEARDRLDLVGAWCCSVAVLELLSWLLEIFGEHDIDYGTSAGVCGCC